MSGVVSGVLLGSAVGTLLRETMSPAALKKYGFRIPFLCGPLVALAGVALYKHVPDMSAVEEGTGPGSNPPSPTAAAGAPAANPSPSPSPSPSPLRDLMKSHKMELALGLPVLFLYCTGFYECLVWLSTYLITLAPHAPVKGAFPISTANLALATLLYPFAGHLADRFGFFPVMLGGGAFLTLASPLGFYLLRTGTPAGAFCGQALFVVGLTMNSGCLGMFLTDHLTTSPHLYSAMALVYNTAMVRAWLLACSL